MFEDSKREKFVMDCATKYIQSLYPEHVIVAEPTGMNITISVYKENKAGSKELARYYVFADGSMNEVLLPKYK